MKSVPTNLPFPLLYGSVDLTLTSELISNLISYKPGICENRDLFKKYLIVERNADNPNRLDVLFPPDYVNQLRVFALLNQFRLQYAEE